MAAVFCDVLVNQSYLKSPFTTQMLLPSAMMSLVYPFTFGFQMPYGIGDILLDSGDVERQAGERFKRSSYVILEQGHIQENLFEELRRILLQVIWETKGMEGTSIASLLGIIQWGLC